MNIRNYLAWNKNFFSIAIFKGVSHADEVLYMFPIREMFFPNSFPTKEDEQIREAFVQTIVDFARTG